ncbi:hypothetical protein ACP275_07G051300 [Erythranthe tilingii]
MSYHSRRLLTPWESRKRKERGDLYSSTSPKPLVPPTAVSRAVSGSDPATTSSNLADQPLSSNRLLAGCMAYEFLNQGTLFGQKFDPARAEALPLNSADWKRNKQIQSHAKQSEEAEPSGKSKPHSYTEVAHLLKNDGSHIPGVVNPTQLARWIQM